MNKIPLTFLVILGILPYLFMATSVVEVPNSGRAFNCTVTDGGIVSRTVFLGSVFYNPISGPAFSDNKRTVMPFFNYYGRVYNARCGSETFVVGTASNLDYVKPGDKVHAYTDLYSIRIFGIELTQEEDLNGFGTGWSDRSNVEGQTILTRLEGDTEVDYFDRKRVSK